MIALEPITEQNALIFKEARLRALQDSPKAFSATYAKESQLTDAEWVERARQWNGDKKILYLAMGGDATTPPRENRAHCHPSLPTPGKPGALVWGPRTACGIAGCALDQDDATRAHLISMWTAPTHRQQGVGRLLVNEILGWARRRGAGTLLLRVTSGNEPAILFYQRFGFTPTGRSEPYPNHPALIEH